MKNDILRKISSYTVEKMLDIDDLETLDWIWINRELLQDILMNLSLDEEYEETEFKQIMENIDFEDIKNIFNRLLQSKDYICINQFLFASLESGYKPTTDIETTIFIKKEYYKKLYVKCIRTYEWILKAMAIDTYMRLGTDYDSLKEVYEELYADNSRIIEEVLSEGESRFLTGIWKFNKEQNMLYFYKLKKKYHGWSYEEANSMYDERSK
ncbi:hypothetical protein IZY60_03395 [Lutibacter sp. B2]|nr:hypothetical protein [Lutibacter sp. B2]